ncbi:metal ABC transporter ATP-binding protein [Neoehrlichia mikurensis]|uniref:Metal ABC transporter ATP-binding protein n=1 Tax=Neoehrlichia mikurensis TaxID=89586 RepID=A0A9Q9F3H7_9RICK|nr:metal ABC transporter ATP-binding protein [Neoehrlichia mikurensis]UTO55217.1 metal ABC transporter ATP-binding protein [Neoehrlichia mikurensis]UTO56137.1 metal ABC transporter ATP-binding protein [Neoehrlichia mikurensis]
MQVNQYILAVNNLLFFYGQKKVIDNISFNIKYGEIVTILGPNGGGKTSLVRILTGIYKNYHGLIQYAKKTVIGYLPQNFSINYLIPITVEYFLLNSYSKGIQVQNLDYILKHISISKILKQQLSEISSGELQLVLLARCLMMKPNLIILDEPVSCMDVNAKNIFYKLIYNLANTYNLSIIMTSHDVNSIMSYSSRIIYINRKVYCDEHLSEINNKNFLNLFSKYVY